MDPQPRSAPIKELDGTWNDCGGYEDRESLGVLRVDVRPLKIPYTPGDRLWVREAFRFHSIADLTRPKFMLPGDVVQYEADGVQVGYLTAHGGFIPGQLRSSIHMPRWASRLTLAVTDVRVHRVQEITEKDAKEEGAEQVGELKGAPLWRNYSEDEKPRRWGPLFAPKASFTSLWNSIHGPDAWDRNDWVAAYTFTVEKVNIDD